MNDNGRYDVTTNENNEAKRMKIKWQLEDI
jgi:hypothetical protein